MLGAGETQVFASVLHGPKESRLPLTFRFVDLALWKESYSISLTYWKK